MALDISYVVLPVFLEWKHRSLVEHLFLHFSCDVMMLSFYVNWLCDSCITIWSGILIHRSVVVCRVISFFFSNLGVSDEGIGTAG